MDIDAEIKKAIQIGERNKEVIELVQNWCAHVEIGQWGGIGLVEAQTGLPIGARFFKCKYARAQGMAGVQVEEIAVDFYDRNCADCTQRLPVRLPNLSELVAERDAARERQQEAQAQSAQAEANALAGRVTRRSELSAGCGPARADIFSAIDAFDREPTEEHRRVLLGMANAAPEQFNASLREALYDVAEAGGFTRTEGVLEVLNLVDSDGKRLCELALRAFARFEGHTSAAAIVERYLSKEHEGPVQAAIPSMIALASPVDGFLPSSGSSGDPRALVRTFQLFPELVTKAIKHQLRSPRKHVRIQACNAVSLLLQIDPGLGRNTLEDLIRSMSLPDDRYGGYRTARGSAAITIAEVMAHYPDEVDAEIQLAGQNGTDEIRSTLVDVYEHVLRDEFEPGATRLPDRAVELSYQRFVELVSNRVENDRLLKAISFLRYNALRYPDLLEKHAETLLGSAALISGDLENRDSPLMDLSLKPDLLKQIEAQGRRQMLGTTLDAILKPIGVLAARKPESIGKLVMTTFDALGDGHKEFKAGLTRSLGYMAGSAGGSRLAMPGLYQAMTNQSSLVRAAAADAYSHLAARDPDDLPPLVHETFLLLLLDPFVIVHSAAVEALRKVSLPARYNSRLIASLGALISAYRQSRENDDLLSACLECVLELQAETADSKSGDRMRQQVLSIAASMKLPVAARFVARNGRLLRRTPGLARVLVKLLAEPDLAEHEVDDLVDELAEVPSTEILEFAGDFRAVATIRLEHGSDLTDELLEILTRCGAWSVASDIARDATARFSDSTWDRPTKLRSEAREIAAALEAAASASDVEQVVELGNRWRAVDKEITTDDEQNKKRRDPFLGLSLENPSE
jgi:hypothetical protein